MAAGFGGGACNLGGLGGDARSLGGGDGHNLVLRSLTDATAVSHPSTH